MNPWWEQAECWLRQADPRMFDLTDADISRLSTDTINRHAAALDVCDRCSVQTDCAVDPIRHNDIGVRGGRVFTGVGFGQRRVESDRVATRRARAAQRKNHQRQLANSVTNSGVSGLPVTAAATRLTATGTEEPAAYGSPGKRTATGSPPPVAAKPRLKVVQS